MFVNFFFLMQEAKLRAASGFWGYGREQVDPCALGWGRINGKT